MVIVHAWGFGRVAALVAIAGGAAGCAQDAGDTCGTGTRTVGKLCVGSVPDAGPTDAKRASDARRAADAKLEDAGADRSEHVRADAATRDAAASHESGDAEAGEQAVVRVPLSGCYNTHTLPVTFGGTQTSNLNLDTGASTLGVAAKGCAACADAGVTPLYNPDATGTNLSQPETLMYAPGFGWAGQAYRDVVSIGGVTAPVDLVAIDTESNYFAPATCDTPSGPSAASYQGTIGFGPDALVLPGTNDFIDEAIAAGKIANAFSIAFCHVGGSLWLGGYDPTSTSTPLQYTPMGFAAGYTVEWTDTIVDGTDVSLPALTQATVDSGGDSILVPEAIYTPIAAALENSSAFVQALGSSFLSATAAPFTNCVTLDKTPAELDAALPTLTLKLGASNPIDVPLTATQSYLIYQYAGGSSVTYCQNLMAAPAGGFLSYYLGMSLMLGHVLVYDRANARFGVAPTAQACPF